MKPYSLVQQKYFFSLMMALYFAIGSCGQTPKGNSNAEKNKMDSLINAIEKLKAKQTEQDSILREKLNRLEKLGN